MAFYAQKDIVCTATLEEPGQLFHIQAFLLSLATAFPGRLTLAYEDAAGGDWLTENGPASGAYLIVESVPQNPDGSRWQGIIGARATSGAIGGYTTEADGVALVASVYVGVAPQGGWNSTSKTFAGMPFSGLMPVFIFSANPGSISGSTAINLWVAERMMAGVLDGVALGGLFTSHSMCFYLGHITPAKPDQLQRCIVGGGSTAANTTGSLYKDPSTNNVAARIPRDDLSAWDQGYVGRLALADTPTDHALFDMAADDPVGLPLMVRRKVGTTWRCVGSPLEMASVDTSIPSGTTYGGDIKRLAWGYDGYAMIIYPSA